MAAVTLRLQDPEQAGLAHRLDIRRRDFTDLLGLGHPLAQLRSERHRAGDEVIMAELFRPAPYGRSAIARFTQNGHGGSSRPLRPSFSAQGISARRGKV